MNKQARPTHVNIHKSTKNSQLKREKETKFAKNPKKEKMNNKDSTKITIQERFDSAEFKHDYELSRITRNVRTVKETSMELSDDFKRDKEILEKMNKTMEDFEKGIKSTASKVEELREQRMANYAKCFIFIVFMVALIFHFTYRKRRADVEVVDA